MIKNLVILEKEPIKMLSTQGEKQPYIPAKRDRHVFDSDDDDEALVCFKRPVVNSKPKPDSLNNSSSLASQSRVTNSVSRDTVEAKSVQTVNQTSYKNDSSAGNGKSIGLSKLTNPKLASSSSEQLGRQHDNDSLEDSDDDMPLSSRFSTKKAEGNSVSRGSVQNINSTGMQRLNSSKNANCLTGRGPIVKEASAFIDSNANAKSSNKAPHHKADDQQDSDDDEKPPIFRTKAKKTHENSVAQNSNGGEPHFIKPPTALKKPAESSVLSMTNKSNVLNGGEGNTALNHMKIHSAKKSKQMSLPKDNTRNGNLQHANQSSQNANKSSNQSSQNANKSTNQSTQNANKSSNQLSQHANKSSNQLSQHANKSSNQSSQHANQLNHSQSSKPLDPKKSPKEESDSDDEKPLVHRFTAQKLSKPPTEDSCKSVDNSDDEEPLAIRLQRNKMDGNGKFITEKSLTSSKKRLVDEDDAETHFSAKKVKSSPVVKKESTEDSDDEDDVPIAQRMKNNPISKSLKSSPSSSKPLKTAPSSSKLPKPSPKSVSSSKRSIKDSKAKIQKLLKKRGTSLKNVKSQKLPPGSGDGQKWTTLEHNGVIFPPPYQPHGIKMLYNGKPVVLTPEEEEVATFFAVMKETDYATKPKFVENFWHDWKRILGPKHVIQKFELCDFTPIYEWHLQEKEKKKQMSTEEKKALKEEKLKQEDKYMWAIVDGVKEKVGNFRVEPPGLFRGRGEHPKMGKLKKRIFPEDITINVGRDAPIPECTMPGHRWKEIRHDNTVTWLAYWNDPINPKEFKYVFLAASSALKGLSDKEKYEKARMLKNYIEDIRKTYSMNFGSKDKTKKQIAVATYLIDQLALRAGNEKDDDEADTVGCCTLKVENVALVEPSSIQFDFLGKDSIRYFNTVVVKPEVYKAIGEFKKEKRDSDDLFDELDTSKLNTHLKELMPGLTAKVFRTYNASITLDRLLQETEGVDIPQKVAAYQGANKEVAVLCNHQRSIPKTFDAQMERIEGKIDECKELIKELEEDLMRAKMGKPPLNDKEGKPKRNIGPEALKKKIEAAKAKLLKMDMERKTKENLKTVALGTSKINYLDPRITVAWCKSNDVPIEKIFNKSLLAKFSWAMDVEPEYRF